MFKSIAVLALTAGVLAASSVPAAAQDAPAARPHFEYIINTGTLVPTGAQGDALGRGKLTAAQLSYVVTPAVAVTGSFGWARSRDIADAEDPRLDVFTYDVGAELRADRWLSAGIVSLSPFAGAGAGGRSYNYRNRDVDAAHDLGVYGSAGGEIGIGSRVELRLEARDFVSRFEGVDGAAVAATRNDVSFMFGMRVRIL
jgi:hypothetical protein